MAEHHYVAVLEVIAQGHPVCSVAEQGGVSRQTLHAWLRQCETGRVPRLLGHRVSWFRCASQRPVVADPAVGVSNLYLSTSTEFR